MASSVIHISMQSSASVSTALLGPRHGVPAQQEQAGKATISIIYWLTMPRGQKSSTPLHPKANAWQMISVCRAMSFRGDVNFI